MYSEQILTIRNSPMPVLLFAPEGPGPHPGLVIAQHLPVAHAGLEGDRYQIEVAERYARNGFFCAMPYLFHWWPAQTDIEIKRAEFRDDWTVEDLKATFDLLIRQPGVDADRIGILGHCWGGRVSWLGVCNDPRYSACALFYGGRIKLPFADGGPAPVSLAKNIRCPVAGFFGNEDANPSPGDVDDYEAALRDAGVDYEFYRYDDAGHGFQTSTDEQRYREQVSEDAWQKAIAFFNRTLA